MGSRRAQAKPPRAAARQGRRGRRARARLRPDRARPRRADGRGDRAVDHGRDRRDAPRPHGRAAGARQRPDPRGRRVRIGGLILAAGEGRRFGGTKQLAELRGRPLLEHALDAMLAVPALEPVVVVLGPRRRRDPRARRPHGARDGRVRRLARGPGGVAALRRSRRSATSTPPWSRSATSRSSPPQVIAGVLDFDAARDDAVRATYDGQPGHPVLLDRGGCSTAPDELRGDVGFRALLGGHARRRVRGRPPVRSDRHRHARGAGTAMKLEQTFEVQAPLDQVWAALNDLERVAPCLPGRGDHRRTTRTAPTTGRSRSSSGRRRPPTAARSRSRTPTRPRHTATLKARGHRQARPGRRQRDDRQHAERERRRHARRGGDRLHDHRPARPASAAAA